MRLMPVSDDKTQLNIYIRRTTRNRLEALAKQYDKEKGTKVAADIIELYTELWAEAEQAKHNAVSRQREAIQRAIQSEMLKLPMIKTTPTAQESHLKKGKR